MGGEGESGAVIYARCLSLALMKVCPPRLGQGSLTAQRDERAFVRPPLHSHRMCWPGLMGARQMSPATRVNAQTGGIWGVGLVGGLWVGLRVWCWGESWWPVGRNAERAIREGSGGSLPSPFPAAGHGASNTMGFGCDIGAVPGKKAGHEGGPFIWELLA